MQRKWGIGDLEHDPVDSGATPTGSGMIGGSVYTPPTSDESRASDKRAAAVGFGCTYVTAGDSSVVMINGDDEMPSLDGGGDEARIHPGGGDSGGGSCGGGGGGGGGDISIGRGGVLGLEERREAGVHNGGRKSKSEKPLPRSSRPEETAEHRRDSRPAAKVPEGTPEDTSMVRQPRVHCSVQDAALCVPRRVRPS